MATKRKTAIALPDFSDFMECSDRPSLVGKLLINIVGYAGAGNGRCIISDTLPRMGSKVMDSRWEVEQYELVCDNYTMTVYIHVRDHDDPSTTGYAIRGPSLRVTDAAFVEASRYVNKNCLKHPLEKLYGKTLEPFAVEQTEDNLRTFFERSGRLKGAILLTTEGIITQFQAAELIA